MTTSGNGAGTRLCRSALRHRTARRQAQTACTLVVACAIGVPSTMAWADAGNGIQSVGSDTATRALSPLAMFLAADPVVKGIIALLLVGSIVTWTIWIAKSVELLLARRSVAADFRTIRQCRSLHDASAVLGARKTVAAQFIRAAISELHASSDLTDAGSLRERIASQLADVEHEAIRTAKAGTGALATIGSTAPFIGLLGTVWGIMNSFIGIAAARTTNLAVVAPGIAEALLATAVGLVAAIPAVVIYNRFTRLIGAYRGTVRQGASEIARMASRDLDRRAAPVFGLQQAAE